MNKVILSGNIARINKRDRCTYFTIAVYDKYSENHTEFIDVTAFRENKRFFDNNFEVGKTIEITGKLKKERYNEVIKTEVICEEINFIGRKGPSKNDFVIDEFLDDIA